MNAASKSLSPAFPSDALELEQLEKEIDAAFKRAWVMIGVMLGTSLGVSCYFIGRHLLV